MAAKNRDKGPRELRCNTDVTHETSPPFAKGAFLSKKPRLRATSSFLFGEDHDNSKRRNFSVGVRSLRFRCREIGGCGSGSRGYSDGWRYRSGKRSGTGGGWVDGAGECGMGG